MCRAINLGCILPRDVEEDLFFKALGFSKESIEEVVKRGYPPLISYVRPDLTKFLMKAEQVLVDNGLLVLWFSHRSWEAWESVINALLKAGLAVTKVYPVASEHPARLVTKGGTVGFNGVLIISRKRSAITLLGNNEVEAEVRRVVMESIGNVTASKIVAREHVPKEEVRVFSRAAALTVLTRAENPLPG